MTIADPVAEYVRESGECCENLEALAACREGHVFESSFVGGVCGASKRVCWTLYLGFGEKL